VELVPGGLNRIQVEGGPGTRRMEQDPGKGWNWYQEGGTGSSYRVELVQGEWNRIQVEGGPGTRRVEPDPARGWTW
jgi:hypothetical protein